MAQIKPSNERPPAEYDGSTQLVNHQQEAFAHEYLVDFNAQEACKRAGYTARSAGQRGYQLLRKPHVAQRITHLHNELLGRVDISAERIKRELAHIAFSRVSDVLTWNESGACFAKSSDELGDRGQAALEGVEVTELASTSSKEGSHSPDSQNSGLVLKTKVKFHNKLKALELLGKEVGMFSDKLEIDETVRYEVVSFSDRDIGGIGGIVLDGEVVEGEEGGISDE